MAKIPSRVSSRLADSLKRYQSIVSAAKSKDLNEADTSRIVTDILSDTFGFDKYSEITSEYSIRNTYCDLAIKLNGQPRLLIEVKAVGIDLKDNHVKQAVDYAANLGMDWVVLTNAVNWRVFKISFNKPIDKEEVVAFDFTQLNHKKEDDIAILYLLAKEGLDSSALNEFHAQVRAVNPYMLGAVIQSEPVLKVLRKELSRNFPDVKIYIEDIQSVLTQGVLKREILVAPEAKDASKKVQRGLAKLERSKAESKDTDPTTAQKSSSEVSDANLSIS